MSMVLKISMTKPTRPAKTAQNTIQDTPTNRIKRLNHISNKEMKMRISSTSKNLLNINSRSVPRFHRPTTTYSTEDRTWYPRPGPPFKLTHTSRCPNAIHNRKNAKRSLAKGSSITFGLGGHSNVSIQQTIRPNPNLLNLGENTSQPIIPRLPRRP